MVSPSSVVGNSINWFSASSRNLRWLSLPISWGGREEGGRGKEGEKGRERGKGREGRRGGEGGVMEEGRVRGRGVSLCSTVSLAYQPLMDGVYRYA